MGRVIIESKVMSGSAKAVLFPTAFSVSETKTEPSPAARKSQHPLSFAPVGEVLRVMHFGTSKSVEHRLSSMGIIPGSLIQIIENSSSGLIIAVNNTRLAIAPSIAHKVIVASDSRASDFH